MFVRLLKNMKKIFVLLTVLFVTISLVACSFEEEENNQIVNPWVEVNSLDEASKITGFKFNVPNTFDTKTITLIQVMNDELIEVRYDDVILRKGKGKEDYSGDYNSYEISKTENINNIDVTLKGSSDTCNCATFLVEDYSYSISGNISYEMMHQMVSYIIENDK